MSLKINRIIRSLFRLNEFKKSKIIPSFIISTEEDILKESLSSLEFSEIKNLSENLQILQREMDLKSKSDEINDNIKFEKYLHALN